MDGGDYATIIAGLIASFSAWAVSRSSVNAGRLTKLIEAQASIETEKVKQEGTAETSRSEAEKEAYERARAFDVSTIERQNVEILRLQERTNQLGNEIATLNRENQALFTQRESLRSEVLTLRGNRNDDVGPADNLSDQN